MRWSGALHNHELLCDIEYEKTAADAQIWYLLQSSLAQLMSIPTAHAHVDKAPSDTYHF